ncbi:MAG: DUF72 domain-containing protein [Desulforhabdus sp.]|jgi:uncharacterized protein YecE (DUF72 family)|nr:DUF72 domain-containing protein [Desulforhabdus sp.]
MMPGRNDFDPEHFIFRGLHPAIHLGTASDRYAGWIGQIYPEDQYKDRISRRTNRVGGKSFQEQVLPVESVAEYFQHFRVLEIDFTFYSPLLDEKEDATHSFKVLKNYQAHMQENDFLFLKVPQMFCAQKLRRGGGYLENPMYLNAKEFIRQFYQPAEELLGANLRGFVFEQEYQRSKDRAPVEDVAKALDRFFTAVPKDQRYHIELRTETYLSAPVFNVLEKHGIGQVLSHWTWLPSLAKQFTGAGCRFISAGKQVVVRLMTPIGVRYEEAYAKTHPFNKLIDGMLQPAMIIDTTNLMVAAIRANLEMNVIINNRAGGNAPQIAQLLAQRFVTIRPENAQTDQ